MNRVLCSSDEAAVAPADVEDARPVDADKLKTTCGDRVTRGNQWTSLVVRTELTHPDEEPSR